MTMLAMLPQQALGAQANVLRVLESSFPLPVPPISQTLSQLAASIPALPFALPGGGAPIALPGLGPLTAILTPAQPPTYTPQRPGARIPTVAARTGLG